jgi:hypothetical protein
MTINWYHNDTIFNEENIGDNYGFIFVITNLTNDKKYIGKKFFYSMKSKIIKGKKKKYKIKLGRNIKMLEIKKFILKLRIK